MSVADTLAPAAAQGTPAAETGSSRLHQAILASLDEDGAMDVVSIELAGKSSEADVMVIASGRSTRHVSSISEKLIERLKAETGESCAVEGREAADWVLIDAGDVIVHIFRPEVRDFYQLERMWIPAPDRTARAATN